MHDLVLHGCRLPDRDAPADVAIAAGRIVSVGDGAGPARETLDAGGRLVTPGLVEAHIHLDKALLAGRVTTSAGTLEEAIRVTGAAKRGFTREDIAERARRVLDLAVAAGTTAMRAHVEVDPIVGLTGLQAMLALKREYAPAVDLQLCAFAQEGILQSPGTEGLLRQALRAGADLVGGCPYNDTDGRRHIEIVFALAREFGVDADFHVDFFDEADHLHVLEIVRQTVQNGWQGRVALGHLTELAALPAAEQDAIAAQLAAARIGVISLPATDLYLMGRRDEANVRRGLTPIRRLLAAGVPVALATNNVRNPFTPVGTADLAHLTFLAAVAAHMGTPELMRELVACVTTHAARILGVADHGLAPGCRADLVVWECERPEEIVMSLPARRWIVKGGRITIEHERRVVQRWREGRG
ncbi:MAG: amidohydrolase family protein [Candidatus Rokubacteria bacterium]|nr:amidohydrolase family protein [Candidatus Rokubacteria bacterium]